MTKPNTSLVSLAERCEAATGPDRELDTRIADEVGWKDVRYDGYGTWRGVPPETGKRRSVCTFTRSLDAAMTLVRHKGDALVLLRQLLAALANDSVEVADLPRLACVILLRARSETHD